MSNSANDISKEKNNTEYIKSPMNYTGGKFKLLGDIIPALPNDIDNFVDLFCGGLNVGINVNANTIYANDQISYIIDLFQYFQNTDIEQVLAHINARINGFSLSQTNKDGYLTLRQLYNEEKNIADLFVLTCYSFNHQIRFNSSHGFNSPFGKERSSFNATIEKNLIAFVNALHEKNVVLEKGDFLGFDFSRLHEGDVVYCDPPYLISIGSYNDGKRGFKDWGETEERQLLGLLSELDDKGIRFLLSNVFYHKGEKNDILMEWAKNYNVHYLDKTYSNCSYHLKDRETKTVEVLVTNYNIEDKD